MTTTFPRHFYSLDALRGLAALVVVLYHWPHFFQFQAGTQFIAERQPFYSILKPLYVGGWRAVDLFFCLSGFIFYWLYSEMIAGRQIFFKEFFILRFSRLYPLHLVSLLIVGVAQILILLFFGSYVVYINNNWYHFVLQLFFVSGWGWEHGYSFNGPVWSVSVEVLLYLFFFLLCRMKFRKAWHFCLAVAVGYLMMKIGNVPVGRGMFSFFIGGLTFRFFLWMFRRGISMPTARAFLLTAVALWMLIPFNHEHNFLYHAYRSTVWYPQLNLQGKDIGGFLVATLSQHAFELFLFPITILALALTETCRGSFGRRLSALGQISYSSYLLHFPLQIMFFFIALKWCSGSSVFYLPLMLFAFFFSLIILSLLSYRFFERPMQGYLRKQFLTMSPDRAVILSSTRKSMDAPLVG